MGSAAGPGMYDRISLVSEVLNDRSYLDAEHDGDEVLAAEALEKEHFPDLCGAITLWHLVEIYRLYPSKEAWRERRYNIRAMALRYRTEHPSPSATPRPPQEPGSPTARRRQQEASSAVTELQLALRTRTDELQLMRHDLESLRAENRRLREALAVLIGEQPTPTLVDEILADGHEGNGQTE